MLRIIATLILTLLALPALSQVSNDATATDAAAIHDLPIFNPYGVSNGDLYGAYLYGLAERGALAAMGAAIRAMPTDALWELLAIFRSDLDAADRFISQTQDGIYNVDKWQGRILPRPDQDARQRARAIMALAEDRLGILEYDLVILGRYVQTMGSFLWIQLQDESGVNFIAYDMVSTIAPPRYRYNPQDRLCLWLKQDLNFANTWAIVKFEVMARNFYTDHPMAY